MRLFATVDHDHLGAGNGFLANTVYSGDYITLAPQTSYLFVMDVRDIKFDEVEAIGFVISLEPTEQTADFYHISANIPEPLTIGLLALGGLGLLRRKSRQ